MRILVSAMLAGLAGIGESSPGSPTGSPSAAASSSVQAAPVPVSAGVPVHAVTVVNRLPHDRGAFTEGLLWCDGALYESTGKEGASDIRRVTPGDGRVARRAGLSPDLFGEGIACWNRTLISVTWKTGIGFRWALPGLTRIGAPLRYAGEGWGMTTDPRHVILSDGSPTLRLMDPQSFTERGRIAVTMNGRPLKQLNELEYVKGAILANIWMSGFIARIDPATGRVTALIDLRPLVAEVAATDPDAVPNGIAYDAAGDRLFVTGKYWPTLFEIRLGEEIGRVE